MVDREGAIQAPDVDTAAFGSQGLKQIRPSSYQLDSPHNRHSLRTFGSASGDNHREDGPLPKRGMLSRERPSHTSMQTEAQSLHQSSTPLASAPDLHTFQPESPPPSQQLHTVSAIEQQATEQGALPIATSRSKPWKPCRPSQHAGGQLREISPRQLRLRSWIACHVTSYVRLSTTCWSIFAQSSTATWSMTNILCTRTQAHRLYIYDGVIDGSWMQSRTHQQVYIQ